MARYPDITLDQVLGRFDFFTIYGDRTKCRNLMAIGDTLVREHNWVCFHSVRSRSANTGSVRSGFVGYASHEAAVEFMRSCKRFPVIPTCTFYKLGDDEGVPLSELVCEINQEKRDQRDQRLLKARERAYRHSAAMIAQKILGEGVFSMVRRSRELRGCL